MSRGEEKKSARAIDWPLIMSILLFGGALLWAGVIVLQAWFHTELASEVENKVTGAPLDEIHRFIDDQEAALQRYERVAGDGERIRLPIERAMDLVRQEDQEER